jgi:acyl-CoA reductase-like NAD-dependent aldehyde dehydrogenase
LPPINVLTNPYTKAVIAEYTLETFESADAKIGRARGAKEAWAKLSIDNRRRLFRQAIAAIEPELESYAHRISDERFKPVSKGVGRVQGTPRATTDPPSVAEPIRSRRPLRGGQAQFRLEPAAHC